MSLLERAGSQLL